MYYPQSQIKTNLYSNGELSYKSDNKPYIGNYFSTSNGLFFTGKTPQDLPNLELIINTKGTESSENRPEDLRFNTKNNYIYSISKKVNPDILPIAPQYNPIVPTSKDYEIGEFTRYFCKKTNENLYIEINNNIYQQLTDKNPKLLWDLYFPFSLSWQITGDKLDVVKTNKNMVELTSFRLKLPFFNLYLNKNYNKYYKDGKY